MKAFRSLRLVALVLLVALTVILAGRSAASSGATTRVSVDSNGNQGDGGSEGPAISADGRYAAFYSSAANLVTGDTNGQWDVFVHDRQTGVTQRVSVDSDGNEANGASYHDAISADGRNVGFMSGASNLVPGDTNSVADIFVHDRQTGVTQRVSVDSDGSEANGASDAPALSADGRFVAFTSDATNLVAGDTNSVADIFVRDRQTGVTQRVSVDSDGSEANGYSATPPTISADGRFVAFRSQASNLVPDDTNSVADVFVHDRQTGVTQRVSVDSNGNQGNASSGMIYTEVISADGRFVAFRSQASNLVAGDTNNASDTFVHDRETAITERVSVNTAGVQANSSSDPAGGAISNDGRYVAFGSYATNLVTGDTNNVLDVFVRDRQVGATTRVSVDSNGNQGDGGSYNAAAISADGSFVAFKSQATNLVPGDTNSVEDVFVHERSMAVGGLAELPEVSDSSGLNYIALAALAVAALLALTAGAWYARRRWLG